MRIAIRADASVQIGTGHVMRCLTLAEVLRDSGAAVEFITRSHPGNLNEHIKSRGFKVHLLPDVSEYDLKKNLNGYEQWLGVDQETDAEETIQLFVDAPLDWLVVDHYALDQNWEAQLRYHVHKIMVIDDLADRPHACDLLLDQNLGRQTSDYTHLVPKHCTVLVGPQYAMLRPEFASLREYSLKRRETPVLKQILITMGGVDQPNATGHVLEVLKGSPLPEDCRITVVMGLHAPWLDRVREVAQSMPWKTKVQVNICNMAQVMADSDLAIGAAGVTTWERCCLGLPGIQLVIADNQLSIAKALASVNAIKYVENLTSLQSNLVEVIKGCRKMSLLASSITDGRGCELVCNNLLSRAAHEERITLKPVAEDDCEYVYSLQTEDARKYSRRPAKPEWEEHVRWFKMIMESEGSALFIIAVNQQAAGILRLDDLSEKELEISIIVAPDFSGRGMAKRSLSHAFSMLPGRIFKATIHKDNVASKTVFEKLGFSKVSESGFFIEYKFTTGQKAPYCL